MFFVGTGLPAVAAAPRRYRWLPCLGLTFTVNFVTRAFMENNAMSGITMYDKHTGEFWGSTPEVAGGTPLTDGEKALAVVIFVTAWVVIAMPQPKPAAPAPAGPTSSSSSSTSSATSSSAQPSAAAGGKEKAA